MMRQDSDYQDSYVGSQSQNQFKNDFKQSKTAHKPKRLPKLDKKKQKSEEGIKVSNFVGKGILAKENKTKQQKQHAQQKRETSQNRQVDAVCQILKYMLGEYQIDDKIEYCNDMKTCENWQVDEIMKQTSDTNLGDFIIKCPNPDNIPQDFAKMHEIDETDTEVNNQKKMLTASQAMQFYLDLFDIETAAKLEQQREQIAYLLAFFLMRFNYKSDDRDPVASTYVKIYNYFKSVQKMNFVEYVRLRQKEGYQENQEAIIRHSFESDFRNIKYLTQDSKSISPEDEKSFRDLKKIILQHLSTFIVNQYSANNGKQSEIFESILTKIKSLSGFLKTIPQLLHHILVTIRSSTGNDEKRPLYGGQFLKKTIIGQNIIWVNSKCRPSDITTLLRFCLQYKLVIKNQLFVRTFMSRTQQHIMLVVKISQEILEDYAQKYKLNMQVDLGATDLFSFQPVDNYFRPLRLHSYVRDLQFKNKYHIQDPKGAISKQDQQILKSIESQLMNIYKKAQDMNEDELRTKIIIDQFEVDRVYEWISRKLSIDYIDQKVLTNDYNNDNPTRQTWQCFYVYNKMILGFIKRIQNLYNINKNAKEYILQLNSNIGMILRLMFNKAIFSCNHLFYNMRNPKSIIPRAISNIWTDPMILKNIWNHMKIQEPSGFSTYKKNPKKERMWRKFEINELKDRSKFFPSERLILTNKVIYDCINISKSLEKQHIADFYPLHDPYVLKNIEISPYIASIKSLKKSETKKIEGADPATLNSLYGLYECQLTQSDFTKMSIVDKLGFKITQFTAFSTDSVRYYCGQKIAFYFEFMKFLAVQAFPLLLPAFIIQCLLWAQNSDITAYGTSKLTQFNNIVIFIFTFINLLWTTNVVERWKAQQKKLAQKYGVSELKSYEQKRVKFEGSFKRDFETDNLNFQYVPGWKTILKTIYTIILNLSYVALVSLVILLLFILKTYLYQSGYSQTLVNQVPSILISIAVQIFNKVYAYVIKMITIFENHKTISEFEGSLVSKSSLITFVVTFYSIFIYAYFSDYLSSSYLCQLKTTTTLIKVNNCSYFVSEQLLSFVMVDMAVTIVNALLPYLLFKLSEYLEKRNLKSTKFAYNFFEAIDDFYEEQDKMQTYMFNQELDNTWMGYMSIINAFAATALFAPALPFAYVMMFVTGIIRLHASKYEVIYLKKRPLPIKANSINWWIKIIEAISYCSILTNIAYMIYTRQVFTNSKGKLFFLFILIFFVLKTYMLSQYSDQQNQMAKRNEIKTMDLLLGRRNNKFTSVSEDVNTDIENVIYDEKELNRQFHNLKIANINKLKKKKTN